jgi:hypothetical protein
MKNFLKYFFKKYVGEIMIIIGSGLFSYNLFNFSYKTYGKGGLLALKYGASELEGIAYYYSSDSLTLISIGVILIISGILIIRHKKA